MGDDATLDDALGKAERELELPWRSGELGRRVGLRPNVPVARFGELFLSSVVLSFSLSRTDDRIGEVGNTSSTGFRGARMRAGDWLDGLLGRVWIEIICPEPFTPGIEFVRAIGGVK